MTGTRSTLSFPRALIAAAALVAIAACGGKAPAPAAPAPEPIAIKPLPPDLATAPIGAAPAEAPATMAPDRVMVMLESTPAGAALSIGGRTLGIAPLTLTLSAGQPVEITATLDGYLSKTTTVVAERGKLTVVQFNLAPNPP